MRNQESISSKGTKKYLEDCDHCVGSSKQVPCFEETTKVIINHTQERFDSSKDIAEVLRMMSSLNADEWRPIMSTSASENEVVRGRYNRDLELDCEGESADHRKYVREHEKTLMSYTRHHRDVLS